MHSGGTMTNVCNLYSPSKVTLLITELVQVCQIYFFPYKESCTMSRPWQKALSILNCLKSYGQVLPAIPIHDIILMRWQHGTNMGSVYGTLFYSKFKNKVEQFSPFISTTPDLFPLVPISRYWASLGQSSLIGSHKGTKVTILTAQNLLSRLPSWQVALEFFFHWWNHK